MSDNNDWVDELKEQLASIEHERWADWQAWCHKQGTMKNINGKPYLCIPSETVGRWERQIATKYEDLTEKEKDSDRHQVDRYWSLILTKLEEAIPEKMEYPVSVFGKAHVDGYNQAIDQFRQNLGLKERK